MLKQDLVLTNDKGDKILELRAGMQLSTIRWEYVPEHIWENRFDFQKERALKEAYAVYIRGKFIAVPKNICEVPITIGWRYNI